MKIDSLGIQQYQQINRRDQQATTDLAAQPSPTKVEIPQGNAASSRLAVKAPAGSYAEHLSDAEKKALELLFARFRDTDRFGAAYAGDAKAAEPAPTLGRIVDVKV